MDHTLQFENLLINVLNAMPLAVFVVDQELEPRFWNTRARGDFAHAEAADQQVGGLLRCVNAASPTGECGRVSSCRGCVIRNTVREVIANRIVRRRQTLLEVNADGGVREIPYQLTVSPAGEAGEQFAVLMLDDLREAMLEPDVIPVCTMCKKVRTGNHEWVTVEEYIERHGADIHVRHGVCNDCMKIMYP